MREILFRGRRVDNGEWETGSLVYARMGTSEEQASIADKMTAYHTPVIPETVGQYIGLCDKNGTKIFEGDILSAHLDDDYPENETMLEVVWYNNGWYGKSGKLFDDFDNGFEKYFEVIGNIFDNPELLKKE